MKAILEFSLPEDQEDYEMYSKTIQAHCALHKIREEFRRLAKSDTPTDAPTAYSLICGILGEYDLDV